MAGGTGERRDEGGPEGAPPGPSEAAERIPSEGPVDDVEELVARFIFRVADEPGLTVESYVADQPEALRDVLLVRCREARMLAALFADDRPAGAEEEKGEQLGDYELLRPLGRGSMARVFLARDTRPEHGGREVALKVLRVPSGVFGRAEARFRREASTLAKLSHPGLAAIHEIGEADGKLFIAMEYVDGRTLESHLRAEKESRFPHGLPADTPIEDIGVTHVAELVADLAEALQAAHEHEVVHRDLKPGNIMIDQRGRPRLLDFGLARDLAEASISAIGDLTGTPHYMSPEQADGRREGLDHRADVFSLGVLLFEMLTLRRPFEAGDLEGVLLRIAHDEPTAVRRLNPTVPHDLAVISRRALEKDPDRRYPTAAALASDLRAFVEHRALADTPFGDEPVVAPPRRSTARGVLSGAAAGLAVAVAAWFGWSAWQGHRFDEAREQLPAVEQLATLEPVRAARAAIVARELRRDGDAEAAAPVVEAARRRGELELREWAGSLERAFASAGNDTVPPEAGELLRGARHLATAAILLGDGSDGRLGSPALHDLLGEGGLRPRISVLSDGAGDQVGVRRLDPAFLSPLGTWEAVGESPVISHPLDPGPWLVRVTRGDTGHADTVRWLDVPRADVEIALRIVPGEVATRGMVRVETRAFTYGRAGAEPPLAEARTALAPFWIDRTEVSRATYRAFLLETGRPAPPGWGPDSAERDRMPATGMTLAEARACASWLGKRLPTAAEWERAARGTGGLLRLEGARLAADGPRAVDDDGDAGPERLLNALGNVAEWTATPWIGADGRVRREPGLVVIVKGGSHASPGDTDLTAAEPLTADTRRLDVGFRCARSAAP